MIFTSIIAFIQAIPAITGGVNNFINKYYDSKVQLTVARLGCTTDVAKALVSGVVEEGKVRVSFLHEVAQSPYLMVLISAFAAPVALYNGKVIVWDTMLGWGTTPAIHGDVATYMNIVVTGIFGVSSVKGIAEIVTKWRKTDG